MPGQPEVTTIQGLSGRHLRAVISGLNEILREKMVEVYKNDPGAQAELRSLSEAQAGRILQEVVTTLKVDHVSYTDEELRSLLLLLAEHPEFRSYLNQALERRLLVSVPIDLVVVPSLIVFLLSIKWKFKAKKSKNGKTEFEFEASKEATPLSLLRSLVDRIPRLGSNSNNPPG